MPQVDLYANISPAKARSLAAALSEAADEAVTNAAKRLTWTTFTRNLDTPSSTWSDVTTKVRADRAIDAARQRFNGLAKHPTNRLVAIRVENGMGESRLFLGNQDTHIVSPL